MTSAHEDQTTGPGTDPNPDIEQIQAEIEQTRQDLGETVDALTSKLDVKSRARERLDDTKRRAAEQLSQARTKANGRVTTVRTKAGGQLTTARTRATGLTESARAAATTPEGKPKPAVLGGAAAVAATVLAGTGLLIWRWRR